MKDVIAVIGSGSIGQAIARRISAGKHVILADLREENANAATKILSEAGFEVSTAIVDVSSRESVHALVEAAASLPLTGTATLLQRDQARDREKTQQFVKAWPPRSAD